MSNNQTVRLREDTLLEMKRKRHAYPHEVGPIVDELLALRRSQMTPDDAGAKDPRAVALRQAEKLIDGAMYWDNTPQGRSYWKEVSENLRLNADKIDLDPDFGTYT